MRILIILVLLGLLPSVPAAGEEKGPGRPIDQVLKGRFVSLDKNRVVIRYDLSDPVQLEDWKSTKPFRVAGDLEVGAENKAVRVKGVGALCHRAAFEGEVSMAVDVKPWKDRDLGIVIMEMEITDQWVLFSLNDLYFQKYDGAKDPCHMITRFGVKDDSDAEGAYAFRYIARGKSPDIRKFQTIRIEASKKGVDDSFQIGDRDYSGVEMGRKLLDMQIGFYVVDSEALLDEIVVSGKLAPRWLEDENVDLRLSKPIDTVEPETEAETAAKEKLAKFTAGELPARDLLPVLADVDVTEDTREAAMKAVRDAGDKSIVPHLVPLLYSTDLKTRQLAYEVVRKLAGRSFGYNPKAEEDKRSEAVQKLLQHIQKNADEFKSAR